MPLTKEENIFNYRLSRARGTVENTFGILVSRFRIFEKKVACKLSTVDKIVKNCCALHNWHSKTYLTQGSVVEERIDSGEFIPGRWRSEVTQMQQLQDLCLVTNHLNLLESFGYTSKDMSTRRVQ